MEGRPKQSIPAGNEFAASYISSKPLSHRPNFKLFTTWQNFVLVGIESICRQRNECNLKTEILYGMIRKRYGKRRKCWLPAFFPIPTVFSQGSFFRVVKSQNCVVKG